MHVYLFPTATNRFSQAFAAQHTLLHRFINHDNAREGELIRLQVKQYKLKTLRNPRIPRTGERRRYLDLPT